MQLRNATFLRVVAGWTFFVWIVLIKNMLTATDHSIGFRAVHIVLAIISIGFGIGMLAVVRAERARS
jgi:hypothetical protein